MQDLVSQFFEALLFPAIAAAMVGVLLTLIMPRQPARPTQPRPIAPVVPTARQRTNACLAAGRYPSRRGTRSRAFQIHADSVPSSDVVRPMTLRAPQRYR
ncbi:MAG: hypothetical protein ABW224_18030 [Kibdelosporangium sp.]